MSEQPLRPAAFLDRDGVINVERDYVHRIEDFTYLPNAIEGLRGLQRQGYLLIVATNQAGIGRGYYSEQQFEALTNHMTQTLAVAGVTIDDVYHCPHHPTMGIGQYHVECDCRKPKPGMLLRAAKDLCVDLAKSVLIGDKTSDIAAGRAAAVGQCILVRSGQTISNEDCRAADACLPDLLAVSQWLERDGGG